MTIFIRKKVVNEKDYFYLVEAKRKGKKVVHKHLVYLGNPVSLPSLKKIIREKKLEVNVFDIYSKLEHWKCYDCGIVWSELKREGEPDRCPECGSKTWKYGLSKSSNDFKLLAAKIEKENTNLLRRKKWED